MKQYSKLLWVIIILGSFVVSSIPAFAGAYVYAGKRKKIYCGIVGVPGASQPFSGSDTVGNMFELLDQRIDMKPSGWSFENPLAPGTPSTGLPKSDPNYWIINLTTVRDLSRLHVLYLPASGQVALTDHDREKLRKFVDGGGVLWIDNASPSSALTFTKNGNDTFFIKDLAFERSSGYDFPASRHHPLLTVPYWITEPEITNLGAYWGQCSIKEQSIIGVDEPVEFDVVLPVVSKGSGFGTKTSIGALAYGSGRIVVTSNFVGRGCYMRYPYSMPSLKFAYNVIAWASSWTHLRKDPRHSGASIDTVGGTRLINMWTLPGANPNSGVDSAPVIYKNVVFYSSGSRVFALDLRPQDDLDQDGNPDDGFQGIPSGMLDKGQDIIWVWDCAMDPSDGSSIVSSPTVVTAMSPCDPNATIDAVLVMSGSGTVYMLNAFPVDNNRRFLPATAPLPLGSSDRWATGVATDNPYPPLYQNGWIYAVAGDGLLYAYSPALECWVGEENPTNPPPVKWELPTKQSGVNTLTATPRSGPSFGYMENEGGGTLVGMVYWFTSALQNPSVPGGQQGEQNDHILGVPTMVSKDRLRIRRIDNASNMVECQVTYTEGFVSPVPKPRVWYRNATGNMIEVDAADIEENKGIGGAWMNGTITFRLSGMVPSDTLIYATYALSYGQRSGQPLRIYSPRIRQPLEPRTGTSSMPPTEIAGIPAMGPNSMIYVNGKRGLDPNYGGSVYGIFNDGNTQLTKWHYFLHSGVTDGIAGTSAEGFFIPGVVAEPNPNPTLPPESMISPMPTSSPVVSGDKVFVTVSGTSGGPKGALLCFKANSDFVIRITESAGFGNAGALRKSKRLISETTNREMLVKVWQPNLLADSTFTVNPLIEAVPVPKDMIDYQKGTITIDNFDRLKIRSAADPTKTNTLSPSLPVWVFLDNVEIPIDFSTWGPSKGLSPESRSRDAVDLSGWNNLLWYYIIPDSTVHNSPVVIGDKVYVVADSGKIYALDTETGETASIMTSQKPEWEDTVCNPFGGQQNTSIAGSNGVLVIPGSDGLYAYTNATTLTTDSNRIVELDGAGELTWALDSIMWPENLPPANDPPAVKTGSINKPARAKYIGTGDILLVNSGANQVARIDKSGTVGIERFNGGKFIRWIFDRFTDPRRLLRPGQKTKLQSPTDAILWQEVEDGELVIHCVVADSGNHRVLDLVYRVRNDELQNEVQDPESGYYLPELNWVSKTDSMYDKYVYNSLQMVPVYTGNAGSQTLSGHNIWAAISTHHTGNNPTDVKDLGRGGAIVALKYRASASGRWNYGGPDSGAIVAACDRVMAGGQPVLLSNPRCFELFQTPATMMSGPETHLLIADDNGVFEVSLASTPPSIQGSIFTDAKYRSTYRLDVDTQAPRPIGAPLVANSVQKLPNNNWLITNGFLGMFKDHLEIERKFTGEVFELDPRTGEIVWCSPKLTPIPPVDWKQTMDNSYMIQQPRSAFRRY